MFDFIDTTVIALIIAALIGMILDFVSGFVGAVMNHCISSEKMRVGLWHKLGFIGIIIVGIYAQWLETLVDLKAYIGFDFPSTQVICICICCIEIVSIIENLKKLNPDIGKVVHKEDDDD